MIKDDIQKIIDRYNMESDEIMYRIEYIQKSFWRRLVRENELNSLRERLRQIICVERELFKVLELIDKYEITR